MYKHLIFIGSDFSSGKRIGFHISYELKKDDSDKSSRFRRALKPILDSNIEGATFAVHDIVTSDKSWESVVNYDPFFEGVELEDKTFTFIHKLSSEKPLKAIDIAHLIVLSVKCTPLKLQKLLFLSYADYLVKTGKKMFSEDFIAYKLGPVVEEVYSDYRGRTIDYEKLYNMDKLVNLYSDLETSEESSMVIAKVTGSKDGFEIYESCLETIEKYGKYSASQLVDITHEKGKPWDVTYQVEGWNCIIDDKIIMKHHI